MLTLPSAVGLYVYTQPTDMRCGVHRLAQRVEGFMQQDPFSGHVFVFFNQRGDKCKMLFWDRTGFVLWYKQLEEGVFEKLPAPANTWALEIDAAKLTWILEGIDLFKSRRRKRYERKIFT